MIKSISENQEEIIINILNLHSMNKKIDLDPTYSKGLFYKKNIPEPKHKFDINPQMPGVIKSCATNLPLEDESIPTIMFDPPFLATKGPSLKKENTSNKINKRFGVFPSELELHQFYDDAIREMYRVCDRGGILIFKCQDKVSSGKQYFSHCKIYEMARCAGWYPVDLFVLVAKNRLVADWQKKNQKHARKYHSYFWVFKKTYKNICI